MDEIKDLKVRAYDLSRHALAIQQQLQEVNALIIQKEQEARKEEEDE